MVRRGFAGGIRAVGLVQMGFCERRRIRCQTAIHLVGADVQETETVLMCFVQAAPISTHRFEQLTSADHIGLNEIQRAMNRTVHMRFSGEMQDSTRAVLLQQSFDQFAVSDIALHKHMARVLRQRLQITQVTRVGEFVQVDQQFVTACQPGMDKIAAYETRPTGNQNAHTGMLSSVMPSTLARTISRNIFFSGKLSGLSSARRTRNSIWRSTS